MAAATVYVVDDSSYVYALVIDTSTIVYFYDISVLS